MSEERKRVDFDYNCEYYKFFKILSVYYIYISRVLLIFLNFYYIFIKDIINIFEFNDIFGFKFKIIISELIFIREYLKINFSNFFMIL